MLYLQLALAPVIVILSYIYYRDKYNKEPFWLLFFLFVAGMFSVLPVLGVGYISDFFLRFFKGIYRVAYTAFFQAAFIEEFWKLFFTLVIAWRAKAFDERFDGIVYAVTVSMGFAAVENVMYIFGSGVATGLLRIVTAVPAHAIFGISMGYYLGRAKFDVKYRGLFLLLAFVVPWLMHGIYDFLLMTGITWMVVAFILFLILMYIYGFVRIKNLAKYKVKPNPDVENELVENDEIKNDVSRGFEVNNQIENDNTDVVLSANVNREFDNNLSDNNQNIIEEDKTVVQNPVRNNLIALAVLHFVWGGIKLSSAVGILMNLLVNFGMYIGGIYDENVDAETFGFMIMLFLIIGLIFTVVFGILNIYCGKFLLQKKNRTFCLVMSGFACVSIPLGTLLGIFTFIELGKPHVISLFEANDEN